MTRETSCQGCNRLRAEMIRRKKVLDSALEIIASGRIEKGVAMLRGLQEHKV